MKLPVRGSRPSAHRDDTSGLPDRSVVQQDDFPAHRNDLPVCRRDKDGRKFDEVGQRSDVDGRRRRTSVRRRDTSVRVGDDIVVVVSALLCSLVPFCRRFPLKFSCADHFCFTAREWALLLKQICDEHKTTSIGRLHQGQR